MKATLSRAHGGIATEVDDVRLSNDARGTGLTVRVPLADLASGDYVLGLDAAAAGMSRVGTSC